MREIQRAQWSAVAKVRGLYKQPGEAGYNSDAERNWQDCSMRTRAALILTQGALATERAKQQATTPKVFGMILMQGKIEDPAAWERMATAVNEGKVIEAEATPVLPAVEKGTP